MGYQQQKEEDTHYDFCIVGGGPAGLATLSALSESYSLGENIHMNDTHWSILALNKKAKRNGDKKCKKKRICVIDPNPNWLHSWDKNYDTLEIEYLRSPVKAHPDAFDVNSLFAYAHSNNRHKKELLESNSLGGLTGNKKLLPLGESQIGMWDLPSSKLFRDFCDDVLINRLPHDYIQGTVADIDHVEDTANDGDTSDCDHCSHRPFRVVVDADNKNSGGESRQIIITAKAVILAMGAIGNPIVPKCLQSLPPSKLRHWQDLKDGTSEKQKNGSILVVGGGLTAIQTAQYALRKYPKAKQVVLCSRRPITEKNFDVSENWFDRRSANQLIGDFYHRPVEQRLEILKRARGGGSVPATYMDDVRCHQNKNPGHFVCIDGDIILNTCDEKKEEKKDCGDGDNDNDNGGAVLPDKISITIVRQEKTAGKGTMPSSLRASSICTKKQQQKQELECQHHHFEFDSVWLACGMQPDFAANPLVSNLLERWPIETIGGFPCVSEDLEWCSSQCPNLLVVGSLSSLNTGPDAANLMGIRRSAAKVANALDCRSWLHRDSNDDDNDDYDDDYRTGGAGGGVLANPFKHLQWDEDSDTDDESSTCSSCEGRY